MCRNPSAVVHCDVAVHLEILGSAMFGRRRIGQSVEEAGSVDLLLPHAVYGTWQRELRRRENRGKDICHKQVLRANATCVLYVSGPGKYHRITRAAEVRADALAPLEGSIAR